tara:strand:+ start:513 stop:743 length:231 start_codon:yes stop_codon:yes gene_type:complete
MKHYKDIFVVETFEEAQEFRYEHNDEPVEIGTPVGFDQPFVGMPGDKPPPGGWTDSPKHVMRLLCFDGIYFQRDES